MEFLPDTEDLFYNVTNPKDFLPLTEDLFSNVTNTMDLLPDPKVFRYNISNSIERYTKISELGSGAYGDVSKSVDNLTGEIVAIKKLKKNYYSWEECSNLCEVKCMSTMKSPQVVKMKNMILEYGCLFLVFEYMENNLLEIIKKRRAPFSEDEVRKLCFQLFLGLDYVHKNNYLHRDLKPENILVSGDVVKIADFGLAREYYPKRHFYQSFNWKNSHPEGIRPMTGYVCTRWYRAPEILLYSTDYGAASDIWSMGLIMAELFLLGALFTGRSEMDQLNRICKVLGTPTKHSWAEGLRLADTLHYQFPLFSGMDFSKVIPHASPNAIDLIKSICSWNPNNRPTAAEVLRHPFFSPCYIFRTLPLLPTAEATRTTISSSSDGVAERDDMNNSCITNSTMKTASRLSMERGRISDSSSSFRFENPKNLFLFL